MYRYFFLVRLFLTATSICPITIKQKPTLFMYRYFFYSIFSNKKEHPHGYFFCVGVSISPKMIGCKINISQNGRRLLVKARKTASSPIIEFSFLNIVILLLVELQERRSKLSEKPIY